MNPSRKYQNSLGAVRSHGVSLLEMTCCTLFLGIIAAIATPSYIASLDRYRVEMAVKRMSNDLQLTQCSARQTNSTKTIQFTLSDSAYTMVGINSLNRASASYSVRLTDSPYEVRMVRLVDSTQPTLSPTSVTVAFNRFGLPDRGVTVTVGSGSRTQLVQVAADSGKVTIQ